MDMFVWIKKYGINGNTSPSLYGKGLPRRLGLYARRAGSWMRNCQRTFIPFRPTVGMSRWNRAKSTLSISRYGRTAGYGIRASTCESRYPGGLSKRIGIWTRRGLRHKQQRQTCHLHRRAVRIVPSNPVHTTEIRSGDYIVR